MLTVLTRHTVILWGFWHSSFWTQNNLMKTLHLFRLEILIHPISSLADKATWPQRPSCQAQSASSRTLMGDWWWIWKPWRSCAIRQPVVVVAIVGLYRTGKSYLMKKLAGKNKGEWPQQSPAKSLLSIHTPRVQHSDVRRGSERPGRDTESCLSVHSYVLIVTTTCIRSQLFALCLSFFFKSTIFSFPRKKNVVIKNKRCM